jgi:hypothetical protein
VFGWKFVEPFTGFHVNQIHHRRALADASPQFQLTSPLQEFLPVQPANRGYQFAYRRKAVLGRIGRRSTY